MTKRIDNVFIGYLKGSVFREDDKVNLNLQHYDVEGNVVHEESFRKL